MLIVSFAEEGVRAKQGKRSRKSLIENQEKKAEKG